MGKRYAVVDKGGKVINHVLIDDPLPKSYWPGYGSHLVPLEEVDTSNGGAGLDIVIFEKLAGIPQIGDTLDMETGEITKFVPQQVQATDSKGDPITASSAPEVKFVIDVAAKSEGEIIPKEGTK